MWADADIAVGGWRRGIRHVGGLSWQETARREERAIRELAAA